ncbi:MAG: hypothetical protein JSV63_01040 [Candidatus Aenigmatarchaeota archaeon]|nr:MAG: hypothetical protein JSV63_01040 [Candidatus Aenigmarchaeota archaeon]
MPFKVGVTTGLYYIAHDVSLASTLKKIGYTLTRGTDVVEISGDTPHEITETEGEELRNISKNQGLDLLFHGSLTVPMCMPERTDWRDAQDHMEKSVRSAVNAGCKYVLFHACLHFWVELLTYTGTKLTITMCDHDGNFISEVLYNNNRLRNWFVKNLRSIGDIPYDQYILDEDEIHDAMSRSHARQRAWEQAEIQRRQEELQKELRLAEAENRARLSGRKEDWERFNALAKKYKETIEKITEEVSEKGGQNESLLRRKLLDEKVMKKLSEKKYENRRWRIDTMGRLVDVYKIMAHHLFFDKDPQWISMAEVYKDVIQKYGMDYSDDNWLTRSWDLAEKNNDREFKEFFYAVVGAKFLEGHVEALLNWIDNEYIPKELKGDPERQEIAKKLRVTIEIPDARDPKYAGRYMLSHPKQIYAAIKSVRKKLNTDRIWITIDNEHLATQGYDPWIEGAKMVENFPEYGKMIQSVHATYPTPLHSHYPIELGQTEVYQLLWNLRMAGAGKKDDHTVYLIFERGGGDDPFRQAVDALKIMAKFLHKDVPPKDLPLEFYGLEKTAFDERRQGQIMMDHRFDVLKDLFEVPEEEWGLLSTAAVKKGKREIFKKEEVR